MTCSCAPALAALAAEVAVLRREVAELRGERPADGEALATTIFEAIGERAFSARELIEHAGFAPSKRLAAAVGHLSPRSLGRLLASAARKPTSGYIVESASSDAAGRIWCVRRVL
ncbi:hypothetical protein [Methylocella sp.]|uniref:hypothetical protein n=1 Tax=Methylocella sp. TaxID=1978226 RepID=UPI0037851C1B